MKIVSAPGILPCGHCDPTIALHSTVVVGEKGQVVIPKSVRDQIGIRPGDTLMTVVKHGVAVGFVKVTDLPKMVEYLNREMKDGTPAK